MDNLIYRETNYVCDKLHFNDSELTTIYYSLNSIKSMLEHNTPQNEIINRDLYNINTITKRILNYFNNKYKELLNGEGD